MIENLVFTDNKDYLDSFKLVDNKTYLQEIFSKDFEDKDEEKALRALEIKNLLRELSYKLMFFTEEKNLKETLSNITNEGNVWILLRFLFDKYQSYVFENSLRVDVVAQYNTIFEELIDRIITLKLEDKIKDSDLKELQLFLDNEIFSKLFFNKLYEIIIGDEKRIEYKLNHIFGGIFRILTEKFAEHKLEKIFYSFFLQKFFDKYDVLERAIINCNQFSNKKEKKDNDQSNSNEIYENNDKSLSNIEFVKIQIENIIKYIYHESEKSNLNFICNCLIKFCNENRIVLFEEKNRRSSYSNNYTLKRESEKEDPINYSNEVNFLDENTVLKGKIKNESIRPKSSSEEQDEEENKTLQNRNKFLRRISNILINDRTQDENDDLLAGKNDNAEKMIKNKFLKNKRLRDEKDSEKESFEKSQNNFIKIKKKGSNKQIFAETGVKRNETTKRLNFEEEIDEKFIENESKTIRSSRRGKNINLINDKSEIKENNSIKSRLSKRKTQTLNLNHEERKNSSKFSPSKEEINKKYNNTKFENNLINNNTPVKSSKSNNFTDSNNSSAEKLSYPTLIKKSLRNISKKNSFDYVQDSIRLKKSRSMSSSCRSRSSSVHSEESEEDNMAKTRHSPRLQKKSLKLRKKDENLKCFNGYKKKKILEKPKIKNIKIVNRELNSLDKVDISSNKPRIRTPEKFKSPIKNSLLIESKTKEINISSRKNSAKKERKEKIKFGTSIYKEFDPKTPVKSLSYNLKNSPRLKNNLLNKKSNLKKPTISYDKIENKNSRSSSRTTSPLNSNKKRKISQ